MSAAAVFKGGWWTVLAALTLVLLINALTDYGANDVRSARARHRGVAQVTDTTWSAGHGRATIVCRDGWVKQI